MITKHVSFRIILASLCLLGVFSIIGSGGGEDSSQTIVGPTYDVQVGDSTVSYANVEFTGDGNYMVWFEQSTDGSGNGTVWHCGVDPDTGDLIPPDGKGFNAFDSTLLGRANPGMEAQGSYYVGMDRTGKLILVRPISATTGTVTELTTPVDIRRRSIYPSYLPDSDKDYVFWIQNSDVAGSGLTPGNDWFEIQYIDLAEPTTIKIVVRQDKPATGFAPMDIGFVRWFRDKASITYGVFDENNTVQISEFNVELPGSAPQVVTDDPYSKIDPYPFTFANQDIIVAGIDGTAWSHVYARDSETLFALRETIYPPDSKLQNPALAQSHERILFNNALYSTYQVNELGTGFFDTAFAQTGEIWLTTILQTQQQQWLISANNDSAKAEPEPLVGNNKVWIYYSSLPKGANITTSTWALHRIEAPIE